MPDLFCVDERDLMAIQNAVDTLSAIADRKRQVVDVIEPVNDIRIASRLAGLARDRLATTLDKLDHQQPLPQCPPGYVLLPIKPEGNVRELLLRALEDAGPSAWAGTVQGNAGHLYDALVAAAAAANQQSKKPR